MTMAWAGVSKYWGIISDRSTWKGFYLQGWKGNYSDLPRGPSLGHPFFHSFSSPWPVTSSHVLLGSLDGQAWPAPLLTVSKAVDVAHRRWGTLSLVVKQSAPIEG